jgi:serine/threonine protein phosphatase PrpC
MVLEDLTDLSADEQEMLLKIPSVGMSQKGKVPYNPGKQNQDRAVIKYCVGGDKGVHLFGVMDGHGEFGHHVSSFVKEHLPLELGAQTTLRESPETCIAKAVEKVCTDLEMAGINLEYSGTTLVFSVLIDSMMYCANIGDSRCVFCKQNGKSFTAVDFSEDHKPDLPEEKARILAAGGRVAPLPNLPADNCGPMRVWLAEVNKPGLAMSRSIGDAVSHTVGVTAEPEIKKFDISQDKGLIVWASDGVYEFLSSADVSSLIWKNKTDLEAAATKLVTKSTKCWQNEEDVIDDITCVIAKWNMD